MKLYQMIFSPTGGTAKVAEIICNVWGCEKEEIDLLNPDKDFSEYHFTPEDICVVAVPSFGGRVPEPALERLGKMTGGGARAVLAAVYGNRDFDDTLLELEDKLDSAGFFCAAAVAAAAEHSIMHQFGAGRPDESDRKELESFAVRIREKLESAGMGGKEQVQVPGNRPYIGYNGVPMKPKANKDCNKCGKCALECPVHAISKDDPASVDKERCISCMHCIAVCPKKARHNDKAILFMAAQKMEKSCSGRKANRLFI